MKQNLLKSKLFKATLAVMGLLFTGTVFGQTIIGNNQVVDAGAIQANTAIVIQAGGTLNMDASKAFTTITATGGGTSTISGAAAVQVATLSVGAGNTLSVAPTVLASNFVTATLNDQTATVTGTGIISSDIITINASNFATATLSIGAALTVQGGNINNGNGFFSGYNLNVNGHLKITGTLSGITLAGSSGSTIEYSGGNQAVASGTYYNLTLSGTGAKTFSGSRTIAGNFLLEDGASLTLGNNSLTINANADRTTTINGTLTINGDGRLIESGSGNKTLALGPNGYLSLTDVVSGSNYLGLPVFNSYNINPGSTVEYGASDNQEIEDVASPGYGNLVISGTSTKSVEGALDIQGSITISSATFDAGNFTHSLKGNWIKNGGTFTPGSSNSNRIAFTGGAAAAQTIGGSQGTTFRNITFANTGGGVTLSRPTTITSNVTFTSGIVTSDGTNLLIFNDDATSSLVETNAATTSYVNGPVRKVGNDNFTFPIGKSGAGFVPLRVVGIGGTNSTNNAFVAEYKRETPPNKTNIATNIGIDHISNCDYWTLERPVTNGDAVDVTFYWNANNPCNAVPYVTETTTMRAVHYNGTQWNAASTGFGAGTTASGSVTYTGLTTFSPFALGSTTSTDNPLPVVFGDVKAYEKNGGVQIEWSNLTEKDVAEYTIERSANGKDFSAIGSQLPTSNQNDKASYSGFDAIPAQGTSYYRIKAEETTGKIVYSKVLSVNLGKTNQGLRLYPNPISGNQVTVSLSNVKHGKYNLRVVNTAGQDIFKKVISSQSNSLTQTLDLPSSIKPGVYNMIITGDNYRETKTFIVQ